MVDTSQDKEILKQQREEMRKEMDRVRDALIAQMGFNRSDMRIEVRENAVGKDTLFVSPGIDLSNLPDGWKYEANYNLDGATKEVIYRMKNGKYEYIPIGHDSNKSQVVEYRSPEDVVDGILAENQHIDKSQIYFDRNSQTIKIVGVVNDIRMPAGLKIEDNRIVDINDYGKAYNVERSIANEVSKDAMMSGTGDANTYGVKENVAQTAYSEGPLSQYVKPDNEGATIEQYGKASFNFTEMKSAYIEYTKDQTGYIETNVQEGNYHSIQKQDAPQIPTKVVFYELAKVWAEAYMSVAGVAGKGDREYKPSMAFDGNEGLFNIMMQYLEDSGASKVSDVLIYISQHDSDFINHAGFVKVFGVFLSNPRVANVWGLQNASNATPEKVDELVNARLKEHAQQIFRAPFEPIELEDDMVKEMLPQNNSNNENNQ